MVTFSAIVFPPQGLPTMASASVVSLSLALHAPLPLSMLEHVCLWVVGMGGTYLALLGIAALAVPAKAARFLLGFASSRALHFIELLARMIVGASLILAGPRLSPVTPFIVLGWMLLGTSLLLLFLPWQWHRRFAQQSVPIALRHIGIIGVASLASGVFVLMSIFARDLI